MALLNNQCDMLRCNKQLQRRLARQVPCCPLLLKSENAASLRRMRQQAVAATAPMPVYPEFLPAPLVSELSDSAALDMLVAMRRVSVTLPDGGVVQTAVVHSRPAEEGTAVGLPPIVMLHGFDGSLLEFRRLHPLLAQHADSWALDLVRSLALQLGGCTHLFLTLAWQTTSRWAGATQMVPLLMAEVVYLFWAQLRSVRTYMPAGTSCSAGGRWRF